MRARRVQATAVLRAMPVLDVREVAAAAAFWRRGIRSPERFGCRDFDLAEPDGNRVAFGQALHPVPGPGSGETRAGVILRP